MIVYATTDDVAAAPGGTVSDDTTAYLEFASDIVRRATMNDLYPTDKDSLPTTDFIKQAMLDATVTQVITWQQLGVTLADLYGGAASVKVTPIETMIGSGRIMRDPGTLSKRDKARVELTKSLCSRSYIILRNINMASSGVELW